jgi:putative ABC transport system permease protein
VLIGLFAALALLLATAGIYAVIEYSVSQRTREMGLRITLGALPREILALVVGHALRLAAIGVVVGLVASVAQLFGVSPSDPLTIVAVSGLLLLVAAAAAAGPALKALRVDPIAALRH